MLCVWCVHTHNTHTTRDTHVACVLVLQYGRGQVDALDSHGVQGRIERTRELSLTTDAQRLEQLSLRLSQEHDIKSAQASQLEQDLARKDEENTRLRQKLLRLSARVKGR